MQLTIRRAQPSEYSATESLIREAFWNQYAPGCTEHYLAHVMRKQPDFVNELDLVALLGETIVGNVLFMTSDLKLDNGLTQKVLTLGPIAVHPNFQRQGVGRALIEKACAIALELGFEAVVLCGDPAYYSRLGFVRAETFNIRTTDDMYFDALQVRKLKENALTNARGRHCENTIYFFDEKDASDFDKRFPYKEKSDNTPSQKRFQEVARLMRKAKISEH